MSQLWVNGSVVCQQGQRVGKLQAVLYGNVLNKRARKPQAAAALRELLLPPSLAGIFVDDFDPTSDFEAAGSRQQHNSSARTFHCTRAVAVFSVRPASRSCLSLSERACDPVDWSAVLKRISPPVLRCRCMKDGRAVI